MGSIEPPQSVLGLVQVVALNLPNLAMLVLPRYSAPALLGVVVLAIWLHLSFGRGWFWRVGKVDADRGTGEPLNNWPSVVAVIPARDEAETIGRVVTSLTHQDYAGSFSIVIVDDHSQDATAAIARKVAEENGAEDRLKVVSASELPDGWTGKLWALNNGVSAAEADKPTYFWFTDADVTHAPDTLRRLVERAEQRKLDLASLMVLLQAKSFPERMLIPPFVYFFLMLYPPKWTADPDLRSAGAAGGCVLLRKEALDRIGGLAAIRGEVIDDCALARAVKRARGKVWMGLTRRSNSLRAYKTFGEIRDLIARTAFTQLRYSALLLVGTLIGMILTYVAPLALLFPPDPSAKILGAAAWALMTLSFLPTVKFYRLSFLWVLLLPLAALFYTYSTWLSAVRYWLGRGGQWKGRSQARRGA
jgi:hopene-associated glycosyltransferase HpnB